MQFMGQKIPRYAQEPFLISQPIKNQLEGDSPSILTYDCIEPMWSQVTLLPDFHQEYAGYLLLFYEDIRQPIPVQPTYTDYVV